jgi:hypothetical protein
MKGRTAFVVVGLAAAAGLAIYLLAASGKEGDGGESEGTGAGTTAEPGSSGSSSPGTASGPSTRRVIGPRLDPRPGTSAAAQDAGVADSIAVPRAPGVKESMPEKLAAHARQRQLATLRVQLASLKARSETLTKTLARLKNEGTASAVQLQQIQSQLQQSIDAQPRVQALLEKAEQEHRAAEKKKLEAKDTPEAKDAPEAK